MMDETIIMLIVWLSVFVAALIMEILTDALVSIWFCASALITLALSFIPGLTWWGQLIIFLVLSVVFAISLRPVVSRLLSRNKSDTNIDAVIHKKGLVTKEIKPLHPGEVKINGIYWTAIAQDEREQLSVDDTVEVVAVDGNKLIVRKSSI